MTTNLVGAVHGADLTPRIDLPRLSSLEPTNSMRLTYILAVVLAATLHASSSALSVTKDSKAMIENGVSPDIVDPTNTDGQRLLRRVEQPVSDEDELDEDDNDEEDIEEDDIEEDDIEEDESEEKRTIGDSLKGAVEVL